MSMSSAETPKPGAPKFGAEKTGAQKTEAQKTEAQKTEAPKTVAPKTEAPKAETLTPDAPKAGPQKSRLLRHLPLILLSIGATVGAFTLGEHLNFETLRSNREALLAFRDQHFVALLLAFVATYVTVVSLSLPGATVSTLTGGFLFGLGVGTAANVISATLGALILFSAVRYGLGDTLTKKLDASEGRVARLREALLRDEISVLLLMRFLPIVPFFVANLLPALAGIRARVFAATTLVGILPGALVYTWVGVGLAEVFDRGEQPDLSLIWSPHILGPLLGLAFLSSLPMILRALRIGKEL